MSRPLPKHVAIAETLIRRIGAGVIADGARLDPEREMAADWGVAVGTLRKALAMLEAQGMLARVQGSGNYVRYRADARSVCGLLRLEWPEGGGLPTAQVLSVDQLARAEGVPGDGSAMRIRRLRRLDGVAVAVEEIWYLGPGLPVMGALSDSLYVTWAEGFGQELARIEDKIGLAAFPDWVPDTLPNGMAGIIERRIWGADGALYEFSWTWFDGTRSRFVTRERGDRWDLA